MSTITLTIQSDRGKVAVPITISPKSTTPVVPWATGLASLKAGATPSRPPYSNLKGSIASMVVAPSPWTPVENTLRFTNSDAELTSVTPPGRTSPSSSHNPGVALCGPNMQLKEGTEAWIRWRFELPAASFPKQLIANNGVNGAFLLLGELHGGVNLNGVETWPAGVPFGPPATSLACTSVAGQDVLCLIRGYPHTDVIWHAPLVRDQMIEVVFHLVFSANPATGLREVWLNGVQQAFVDGRKSWTGDNTLHQVPATSANPTSLWGLTEELTAYQMLYFTKGLYAPSAASPVVMYHADMRIGDSLAGVS